uniref:Uncharacterized protein n=1 Tax=Arundo donax TaxID=35708 RepID=A0A0A9CC82_ARUDO
MFPCKREIQLLTLLYHFHISFSKSGKKRLAFMLGAYTLHIELGAVKNIGPRMMVYLSVPCNR